MQTILSETFPCATAPCADPVFGPTKSDLYWSSVPYLVPPEFAWYVAFDQGIVGVNSKVLSTYVRAVRGGL